MSGSLTPSGNKFAFEQLTYTDDTNNIKLSAKVTAYADTGKIYSIENGFVTIDGNQHGDFSTYLNQTISSDVEVRININNIAIEYIKLVGETIGAFVTACESYFKPVE